MNEKTLNTLKGMKIINDEVAIINKILIDYVTDLKTIYKNVELRQNKNHLADIRGYGYTLTIQFYPQYYNSPEPPYIRLALFHNYFDTDGCLIGPGPTYPIFEEKHYAIFNEDGQFGWIKKDRKNSFCISEILLSPYISKYKKNALTDENRKRHELNT